MVYYLSDNKQLIFVIGDYGKGDLAFAEVTQMILGFSKDPHIITIPVQQFNTDEAGFCALQIAINHEKQVAGNSDNAPKIYIFMNVAPRKDSSDARNDNAGEPLMYAKLKSGLEIIGVFSGFSFSYIKPMIEKFGVINTKTSGSQFRSRDYFPEELGRIMNGDYSNVTGEYAISNIPDPGTYKILYVDGYGNIKLSVTESEMEKMFALRGTRNGNNNESLKISVSISGTTKNVTYSQNGMFSVPESGSIICMSPGSSGVEGNRFIEISIRCGNAAKEFGFPKAGEEVSVKKSTVDYIKRIR